MWEGWRWRIERRPQSWWGIGLGLEDGWERFGLKVKHGWVTSSYLRGYGNDVYGGERVEGGWGNVVCDADR